VWYGDLLSRISNIIYGSEVPNERMQFIMEVVFEVNGYN
jgi:hypothetical protein